MSVAASGGFQNFELCILNFEFVLYTYRAVDKDGKTFSGSREAGSERELADALRHEGMLMLEAESAEEARGRSFLPKEFPNPLRRVTLVERMVFARNLAVMIGAGLALNRALEALEEQSGNPKFKRILAATREAVLEGKSFAEGLTPHEKIFGSLFINMVGAGEISGNLERVLKILARQMKHDHDIRAKVRGAMIYPAIVLLALVAIGVMMMIYVVPTLIKTFEELAVDLPLSTRIIIAASNLFANYSLYMLSAVAVSVFGLTRLLRSPGGKRLFDSFVLHAPILGTLVQKLNSARFARTLSSLIAAGVPIVRSLEVTSAVLGNFRFRESLAGASGDIQKGKTLSEVLEKHPELYPPMVTQMIRVGEETGTIAKMLLRLALFYEEEVANTTKNLSSVVEPLLMLVIGGMVGLFAISMIQPIYGSLGNL